MALGDRHFINIFNNQMEVVIRGIRCIKEDAGLGKNVRGGCYLFVWGGELINSKKKKTKYTVTLDGCCSKYVHATTNQKHAAATNNGTKEGCKRQGAGRKCNSIILGAIKLGGDKKIN